MALAFCVFHKQHYSAKVVPSLEKFKFKYFGHDQVVLHESDIRKEVDPFRIFANRQQKTQFVDELTSIIRDHNFILMSCVIRKMKLKESSSELANPYHIALKHCLESLYAFLKEKQEESSLTYVVVEKRGKKEDAELELEFRRICDGNNAHERDLPFQIIFADKKAMSSGLQLADLVARPIGRHILNPSETNRAFEILKKKFFCSGGRDFIGAHYENWGLKIFPT